MKRWIAFFLTAVVLLTLLPGCGLFSRDELSFFMNDDGSSYSVTGPQTFAGGELTIPATYRELPVTRVDFEAFAEMETLTSVTLPDSITEIRSYAFLCCPSLVRVELPRGLVAIGSYAFADCTQLSDITIPDSVTDIGAAAFEGTGATTDDAGVYYVDTWVVAGESKLEAVTLKEGTRGLADDALSGLIVLDTLTLPAGIVRIGAYALRGCAQLTAIHYDGTRAEWLALSKGEGWDTGTGDYTVICSDGKLSK